MASRRDASSLGTLARVGAWLGIWTPRKGAPVPPAPKRKLLGGALVLAALLGALASWAVPKIEHGKQVGAAQRRREEAARVRAEVRRLAADQRPHTVTISPAITRGLSPAATRAALVHELERQITLDARNRARRRLLDGPVLRTICEHSDIGSERRLAAVLARYACTAITAINHTIRGYPFVTGYSFRGTIRFRPRTLTWCKENPRPGEGASRPVSVKLARSCAGPLRDIL